MTPVALRIPPRLGCSRSGCRGRPVVLLDAGAPVPYCSDHAGALPADPSVTVLWLAPGYAVCRLCARTLPTRIANAEHFNTNGLPCPPTPLADR